MYLGWLSTHVLCACIGSAKVCVPPWGGDARLGDRVVSYLKSVLNDRSSEVGDAKLTVKHEVTYFDPSTVFAEGTLRTVGNAVPRMAGSMVCSCNLPLALFFFGLLLY